jgi:hypothetical protein
MIGGKRPQGYKRSPVQQQQTREQKYCQNKCCYQGFTLRYWNDQGKCKCIGIGHKDEDAHDCNR